MSKLPTCYYQSKPVVDLAKDLLGKLLVTNFNNQRTTAIITETEAYHGAEDKAAHSYQNKRTKRTETMFRAGGCAYVYLCYGIHHLFNVVVEKKEVPHAVLVRAGAPMEGMQVMQTRRQLKHPKTKLMAGPGTFSQAMGITTLHDGVALSGDEIWIEDIGISVPAESIVAGPRIGVDYAEEHALLPWRFYIKDTGIWSTRQI